MSLQSLSSPPSLSSSPSLSSFPPELQLAVFKSLDSFADVSALMRTSKLFHTTWIVHMKCICSTLLPRAIDCLGEAQDLLNVQERFTPNWQNGAPHDICRIKRLLFTQRFAHAVGRSFEAIYKKSSRKSDRWFSLVNPVDRKHFVQCYYRFRTYFAIFPSSTPVDKCLIHFCLVKDLKPWPDMEVFIANMGHILSPVQLSSDEISLYFEILDFLRFLR